MGWGSVARDNVQVEGVELIRCVRGGANTVPQWLRH